MKKHQKTIILIQRRQIHVLQGLLREEQAKGKASAVPDARPSARPESGAPIIYRSELDYISRCILDYPNIETGGQLFGYWTEGGVPVVLFAIGPGPNANHRSTFFNQDVQYLMAVGTELKRQFGLQHIGEWHSHHQLGLAKPSGHDVSTMVSTIREKDLGRFLLCIGNCNAHSSTLNPFMCDERTCTATRWDIIQEESPMRQPVYRHMSAILQDPETRYASHMDKSIDAGGRVPAYSSGSWMRNPESGSLLNRMMHHVKACHSSAADVAVKLDERGRVHIVTTDYGRRGARWEEDILFPDSFPDEGPTCIVRTAVSSESFHDIWNKGDDTYKDFVDYYQNIRKQY